MDIHVKVVPGAKKELIKKEGDRLKVYVNAPAVEGRANKAFIRMLAKHFGVRKRQIEIIKGASTREKTVRILQD